MPSQSRCNCLEAPVMKTITRRSSLKRLGALATGAFVAPMINCGCFELFAQSARSYSARAIDLLQKSTVLDMLNPFSLIGVVAMFKGDKRATWFTNPETFSAQDLQRFKDSRIDVMHIGVGTSGPDAYEQTLKFIGAWNGFLNRHASTPRKIQARSASFSACKIRNISGPRTMWTTFTRLANAFRC